ncbi:hypothetical protein BDZ97DRAFT_2070798 [Flammula alnicola]|nr:hypothetical protein BDZ97DRAFT_2070798 [Flammula alnicola]
MLHVGCSFPPPTTHAPSLYPLPTTDMPRTCQIAREATRTPAMGDDEQRHLVIAIAGHCDAPQTKNNEQRPPRGQRVRRGAPEHDGTGTRNLYHVVMTHSTPTDTNAYTDLPPAITAGGYRPHPFAENDGPGYTTHTLSTTGITTRPLFQPHNHPLAPLSLAALQRTQPAILYESREDRRQRTTTTNTTSSPSLWGHLPQLTMATRSMGGEESSEGDELCRPQVDGKPIPPDIAYSPAPLSRTGLSYGDTPPPTAYTATRWRRRVGARRHDVVDTSKGKMCSLSTREPI